MRVMGTLMSLLHWWHQKCHCFCQLQSSPSWLVSPICNHRRSFGKVFWPSFWAMWPQRVGSAMKTLCPVLALAAPKLLFPYHNLRSHLKEAMCLKKQGMVFNKIATLQRRLEFKEIIKKLKLNIKIHPQKQNKTQFQNESKTAGLK